MVREKDGENKLYLYIVVAAIIFALIFFILYKNFNFFGQEEDAVSDTPESSKIETINKMRTEEFDFSVFEDSKFSNLKENKVEAKSVSELSVGRKNPFEQE